VLKPALVLLLATTTAKAFAQEEDNPSRKVAVLDAVKFSAARSSRNLRERERFDAAIEHILGNAGWPTVQVRDQTCNAGADCLPSVSQQAGADYVLRPTGEGNAQYGYNLNIEIFSATTTRILKVAAVCDLCNADRIAEMAGRFALEQLATAQSEERTLSKQRREQRDLAPPPPAPESTPNLVSTPTVAEPQHLSWIPWTMIVTGTAAIAYGAWAAYEDGHPTDAPYHLTARGLERQQRSSKTLGIATIAAGGGLAIAGTLWLLLTPSHSTAVAAGPSYASLTIRF